MSLWHSFHRFLLQVLCNGAVHLKIPKYEDHITWNRATLCIHNVLVGKAWIDNYGEVSVINHTTGDVGRIRFHKASSREQCRITGKVYSGHLSNIYVWNYWNCLNFTLVLTIVVYWVWRSLRSVSIGNPIRFQWRTLSPRVLKLRALILLIVFWQMYDSKGVAHYTIFGNYMEAVYSCPESCTNFDINGPDVRLLWKAPEQIEDYRQQYCFTRYSLALNGENVYIYWFTTWCAAFVSSGCDILAGQMYGDLNFFWILFFLPLKEVRDSTFCCTLTLSASCSSDYIHPADTIYLFFCWLQN